MEELVGILYDDEQKVFGEKMDALIDFNKFKGDNRWANIGLTLLEKKDDDLFTALIKFLDNRFGEKIPVNLKPAARKVALAVIDEDVTALKESAPALLNQLVDIPKLPEETEAIIAKALVIGIIEAFELKLSA